MILCSTLRQNYKLIGIIRINPLNSIHLYRYVLFLYDLPMEYSIIRPNSKFLKNYFMLPFFISAIIPITAYYFAITSKFDIYMAIV